jgi:hypothetical protein
MGISGSRCRAVTVWSWALHWFARYGYITGAADAVVVIGENRTDHACVLTDKGRAAALVHRSGDPARQQRQRTRHPHDQLRQKVSGSLRTLTGAKRPCLNQCPYGHRFRQGRLLLLDYFDLRF